MRLSIALSLSIVAGVVVVASIVRLVLVKMRDGRLEVGSVSSRWIAEHRPDPESPSR